jgi:GT2 family glycosyltransferase
LDLDPAGRAKLRELSALYYGAFHGRFEESLRGVLAQAVQGRAYPKLSVILPVFNKAAVLRRLLEQTDMACRAYGHSELRLIFDGCKDASEEIGRDYFKGRDDYPVSFETTPDIFEVRSNNLGIQGSSGEFCAIVQDDNFIYDQNCFFEAVDLFTINPAVAVVGGLAGVNYYPRGHRLPAGAGQQAQTEHEVYWRQDAATDPALAHQYFEVDACMRGPFILRRAFVDAHGAFDDVYAPLYMDDMDLCFRVRAAGWQVWAVLMDVENRSLTMAFYDAAKNRRFTEIQRRNTDLFYSRYTPSTDKSRYLRVDRSHRRGAVPKRWSLERRYLHLKQRARVPWQGLKQLVKKIIRWKPKA